MMVSTVKIWVGTLPKTNVDIVNDPLYIYIYIYIYGKGQDMPNSACGTQTKMSPI